jgi:hypothetical protein
MGDAARGYLPAHPQITPGDYLGVLDNDGAAGLYAVAKSPGVLRNLMSPIGIRAAPASGDPVFASSVLQVGYAAREDGGAMLAAVNFGLWWSPSLVAYQNPWGRLLHAKGAETGANSGSADHNNGAATAAGGWLMYQVFAGDGTATISIDDSANGSSWSALSGATSGSIDCSNPTSGIIQLSATATVRQYLRWQLALGLASTVTFALAFVRG